MGLVGMGLLIIGAILAIVGDLWFLIVTFRAGIIWGLACLFLPIVSLIFLITHWSDAAQPFFLTIFGAALIIGSTILMPGQMAG